jgi:hypothetical protein
MDYPETVTIEYRGKPIVAQMVRNGLGEPWGYMFDCPKCGAPISFRFVGPNPWQVTITDGRITASPSLLHRGSREHPCDWHIWLRNGVAVDC